MHYLKHLALAALLALSIVPANAADQRNITIVNATGFGIKFIGVNPPGDNDFDENELSAVLADGQSVYIKFNQADKGCNWVIKIDWALDGYASPLIPGINLCEIDEIKFMYNRSSGVTSYSVK